ncbi:MAG: VWA domain-containing protein [Elusimicrobia bacterium]|nr:VWA domain-containing protein [Elusimicrobiota bacterium]
MSFKNPQFFLLFIPLAAAVFWIGFNREKRLYNLNFPFTFLVPHKTFKSSFYEIIPFYARILALVLLIIALARPQKMLRETLPPAEGIDIMLLMDTSTSMAALDFEPKNRLEAAKETAADFVSKRPYDRIGITIFGGTAVISCPLTLDKETLLEYLSYLYPGMTMSDGTAIGDGIATALNHIKDGKAKSKIIILLTDGRSNAGIIQDTAAAAKLAAEFSVKIYTIGAAKKGKAKIPTGDPFAPYVYIDDDLNEPALMEIAKITGGKYYRATNFTELQQIYREIDSLEKTKFDSLKKAEYSDLYLNFVIAAFFILAAVIISEKTFFMTVP